MADEPPSTPFQSSRKVQPKAGAISTLAIDPTSNVACLGHRRPLPTFLCSRHESRANRLQRCPGAKDGKDGLTHPQQTRLCTNSAWMEKMLFLLCRTNNHEKQREMLHYLVFVLLVFVASVYVHPHAIADVYRRNALQKNRLVPSAIHLPGELDDIAIEQANTRLRQRSKRHASNVHDGCKDLREELMTKIYDLHHCTGSSDSEQYYICLPCVEHAIEVVQVLHVYKRATPNPNDGKTCYDYYNEHHPKINVLLSTINNAIGESSEWVKGACFTCFEGNFQYRNVAPKVQKFLKVFTTWENCLEKFENLNSTSEVHYHPSCSECEGPFKELLGMYMSGLRSNSLEATSDDICIDVESRYASALRQWNKELACPSHYHISNWQSCIAFGIIMPVILVFLGYMLVYIAPMLKWFWFYKFGTAYQNELYYEEYMAEEEAASRERISRCQPSDAQDPITIPATEASRRKARNKKKDLSRRLIPETTQDAQRADLYYEANSFVPARELLEQRFKSSKVADVDDGFMFGDDEATPPRLQQTDGEKFLGSIQPNTQPIGEVRRMETKNGDQVVV